VTVAIAALVYATQSPSAGGKDARTAAQQKINAQILYEIDHARSDAARKTPPLETGVRIDAHGRALVDVRAPVTAALRATIRRLGGVVLSSSPGHESTIARVPLLKLEKLAADRTVKFIEPAAEATTVRQPVLR
jgi:hypothetical protein